MILTCLLTLFNILIYFKNIEITLTFYILYFSSYLILVSKNTIWNNLRCIISEIRAHINIRKLINT